MPDRPSETALLQAVELLMGQFSEQILVLLEAHARGDVEAEAFEARIRELVGAVSPEVVARHPGRLALARPAPTSPAPQPEPAVPAAASAPALKVLAGTAPEAASVLELEISPLPEPAEAPESPAEPEPVHLVELEPGVEPAPLTEPSLGLEAFPPESAVAEPVESFAESPAILDGVSGDEHLPDYGWEAPPAEPGPEAAPEAQVLAGPEPLGASASEAAPALELDVPLPVETAEVLGPPAGPEPVPLAESEPLAGPAVELEVSLPEQTIAEPSPPKSSPGPPAPDPAVAEPLAARGTESPAILDGVSGYEHLLEPESEELSPPPAPAPAAASLEVPRPASPKSGPAASPRPRKMPSKGVVVVSSTPAHTPGGRPTTPAKPIPQPEAPPAPEQTAPPGKPAAAPDQPSPGPAKAPPSRRSKPNGMGGSVVVTGRTGGDGLRRPDRPSMGFGDQMFGNKGEEEAGDHATTFVSRQVRRGLKEKSTWKSPTKAALLSGLLPGVGDFYLGKVGNGLVFYLLFYILLMLLILRGDLILVGALAVVAMVSSGMSWLGAQKHNDNIHRIQDAPSLQKKTRETTFTFDTSRRRR